MKITGTFLDEISHDIPHQNWGPVEWDRDFASMKRIGIDTVILIRCGHKRFITYPSRVLEKDQHCFHPPLDLVELFLSLAEKYSMRFYFGTYDSGKYWIEGDFRSEAAISRQVVEEVWEKYGHYSSFGGWYLSSEISRRTAGVVELYADLGRFCKEISGGLPVMISPFIQGVKAVSASSGEVRGKSSIGLEEHEREWNNILSELRGAVDVVAFQDGHCDYDELPDYLRVNQALAAKYGMESWTNCESFDRDMPIKFLPIKWEKLLLKLEAARAAGISKAITFEFSHFMSPNSCYLQAHGLYDRYCEYFGIAH